MYFYRIVLFDYDGSMQINYYNEKEYSQKEFEDIIFEVYETVCQDIIDTEDTASCYYNVFFTPEDVLYEDNFIKGMGEHGFYPLSKKLTAGMSFDLKEPSKDKYNHRLMSIMDGLSFDESCWDADCSRLEGELNEDKDYARDKCLVYLRKSNRVTDKNCDNCGNELYYCEHNGFCDKWKWNPKKE